MDDEAAAPSTSRTFLLYFEEGAHHIAAGLDHLLFLVCLLLPAVVHREAGGWRPVGGFREAAVEVLKVVTAFTVAHSLTLALATFGWIPAGAGDRPPADRRLDRFHRAQQPLSAGHPGFVGVAFGFGLLHGIGFADALSGLACRRRRCCCRCSPSTSVSRPGSC